MKWNLFLAALLLLAAQSSPGCAPATDDDDTADDDDSVGDDDDSVGDDDDSVGDDDDSVGDDDDSVGDDDDSVGDDDDSVGDDDDSVGDDDDSAGDDDDSADNTFDALGIADFSGLSIDTVIDPAACPFDLGDIVVTNLTGDEHTLTVEPQPSLEGPPTVEVEGGEPGVFTEYSVQVPGGSSVTVGLYNNCSFLTEHTVFLDLSFGSGSLRPGLMRVLTFTVAD